MFDNVIIHKREIGISIGNVIQSTGEMTDESLSFPSLPRTCNDDAVYPVQVLSHFSAEHKAGGRNSSFSPQLAF
jgi:hypothetical protein